MRISCPDATGLGCDIARLLLDFGLRIMEGAPHSHSRCRAPPPAAPTAALTLRMLHAAGRVFQHGDACMLAGKACADFCVSVRGIPT